MNTLIKLSFFTIISIVNMGCSEKKTSETVKISLHAPDQNNAAFKVITSNMLNYEEVILKEGHLDSMGSAIIQFNLSKPVFGSIKMDDKTYYQIYLEPGYELQASLLSNTPTSAVSYAGTGAETNNYLAHTSSIWDKFYSAHSNFWGAEPEIFLNILDSLSNALTGFHDSYVDTVDLAENLQKLLKIKNEFRLMNLKQQYKLIKSDAFENDIPGFLKHISEEIPFDTSHLNVNMMEYAMVLDLYVRTEIYSPLWAGKDVKEWESAKDQFPLLAHGNIQQGEYPEEIKEYLLAKNISYWLASEGISPALDTIYSKFKKDFSYSAYLNPLEKEYEEWLAISSGQFAPEVTGVTPDGKTVSLSDLMGKVVYIDVWATWCGPCKAEFPYYKSIQKEFEQNNEIEFLFVSVDKDQEKWVNYLKGEYHPEGIQMIEQKDSPHPSIHESYKIWGIPRYILIDQKGKIVNANAPRPSSERVIDAIKEVLKKEKAI